MRVSESSRVGDLLADSDFPAGSQRWHLPLAAQDSLQSAVNALAYREITRTLQPLALWWTQGSNSIRPSWISTRGLPEARAFVAMLAGDWADAGWSSVRRRRACLMLLALSIVSEQGAALGAHGIQSVRLSAAAPSGA